jgi:Protein of unknown function (DUF4232)
MTRAPGVAALFLVVTAAALTAGCSSPSPNATKKTGRTTVTTTALAAACPASSISASVDFTQFGGSSSSVAGALLFRNTGSTRCSLRGIPQVHMVTSDGQAIPTSQAPAFLRHPPTAVLPAGDGSGPSQAGSSFTISSWTCPVGSFSLTVRFTRWTASVPATSGAPHGTCLPSRVVDETLYVGPVTALGS